MEQLLDVARVAWLVLLLPMIVLASIGLGEPTRWRVAAGIGCYLLGLGALAWANLPNDTNYGGLIIVEEGMTGLAQFLTVCGIAATVGGVYLAVTGAISARRRALAKDQVSDEATVEDA